MKKVKGEDQVEKEEAGAEKIEEKPAVVAMAGAEEVKTNEDAAKEAPESKKRARGEDNADGGNEAKKVKADEVS